VLVAGAATASDFLRRFRASIWEPGPHVDALCRYLLEVGLVACVPGSAFGHPIASEYPLRGNLEAIPLMWEQPLYADSNTINLKTVYTDHTYPT
jgi:hypothetical protein